MKQAVVLVFIPAAAFVFSQCAVPLPTSPDSATLHGEVHTELTAYREDLIEQPAPEYPVGPRGRRYQGVGVYRIRFNYDSGKAASVSVNTSSGHVLLDQAAIEALGKWTIKPHSWHSIDVLIRFAVNDAAARSPPSSSRPFPLGQPTSFRPPHSRPP